MYLYCVFVCVLAFVLCICIVYLHSVVALCICIVYLHARWVRERVGEVFVSDVLQGVSVLCYSIVH